MRERLATPASARPSHEVPARMAARAVLTCPRPRPLARKWPRRVRGPRATRAPRSSRAFPQSRRCRDARGLGPQRAVPGSQPLTGVLGTCQAGPRGNAAGFRLREITAMSKYVTRRARADRSTERGFSAPHPAISQPVGQGNCPENRGISRNTTNMKSPVLPKVKKMCSF